MQEQTGLFAGSGGFDVTTGRHGAVIASTAGAGKNRLDTGTLGFSDLHNQADFRTEHQGASVSTRAGFDPAANLYSNAANIAMAGAGHGGHDEGTTRAAVSAGSLVIRDGAHQQQDVARLSRDPDHANGSIGQIFDKEKEQRRLQAAQLIGEIGGQVSDIARTQGQIAGEQAKRDPAALKRAEAQLAAAGNRKPTPQQIAKQAYNNAMAPFGTGSSLQQALSAATAAVQGLAGGNMAQALSGAAAPYLAEQIHIMTTDPVTGNLNASANLMAHAVLGAVTAQLQDGSALAGAAGASAGEYIAQQLYPGVDKSKLSEEQKQSISALSTLAAGLAGGLASDSSAGALSGAQAGKNAVENNALSSRSFSDCRMLSPEACGRAKQLNQMLLDKGLPAVEDIRDKLNACQDAGCKREIWAQYRQASERTVDTLKQMALDGEISREDLALVNSGLGKELAVQGRTQDDRVGMSEWASWMSGGNGPLSGFFNTALREKELVRQGFSAKDAEQYVQEQQRNQMLLETAAGFIGSKAAGKINAVGRGSPLPVPEVTVATNGLRYKSNPKHTLGQLGNRPNAGIEPKDSLSLFEKSIPSIKQYSNKEVRFAVDSQGHVHRFEGTNGQYHWNGSTGDKNALTSDQIPSAVQKQLGVRIK